MLHDQDGSAGLPLLQDRRGFALSRNRKALQNLRTPIGLWGIPIAGQPQTPQPLWASTGTAPRGKRAGKATTIRITILIMMVMMILTIPAFRGSDPCGRTSTSPPPPKAQRSPRCGRTLPPCGHGPQEPHRKSKPPPHHPRPSIGVFQRRKTAPGAEKSWEPPRCPRSAMEARVDVGAGHYGAMRKPIPGTDGTSQGLCGVLQRGSGIAVPSTAWGGGVGGGIAAVSMHCAGGSSEVRMCAG